MFFTHFICTLVQCTFSSMPRTNSTFDNECNYSAYYHSKNIQSFRQQNYDRLSYSVPYVDVSKELGYPD